MQIQPIVLSGGSGSRLWPLSREAYPKQLLPLINDKTMLQDAVLRLKQLEKINPPVIICNEQHRFIVANQMHELGITLGKILLEPMGKNTAPATALGALECLSHGSDALLLVMPADHLIDDVHAFIEAVNIAVEAALDDYLVTFGVFPTHAETGYGYIRTKEVEIMPGAYQVASFIEKPSLARAEEFLKTGAHYWNSGIFLFKASVYLDALELHSPEIALHCKKAFSAATLDIDFLRIPVDVFSHCPSDSIDYAVMEKVEKIAMVPMSAGWSDIGSWGALHAASKQNEEGNVLHGDIMAMNVKNCYLRSDKRMIAAIGIQDQVIVETDDAVLIVHKDYCQDVKFIVSQLKELRRSEHLLHKKIHRPWGCYESLISATRFQVKRITVNPGQRLSLQLHHHRAEHWVVVSGTAKVTRDQEEFILTENQSTFLSIGTLHRLENPGKLPLEIIEVQSGSYLGEDDIVRFSDDYGRSIS
ncbi:MAG: mannose-1-phosphate guanylyltransferase/mannose-6-phosphate isomerase [Legionellales bacterium]|nr:mannose-1-phosphate guanylyltransferase/mannose-6-phosphate isomerase [Legionellales bacterium]